MGFFSFLSTPLVGARIARAARTAGAGPAITELRAVSESGNPRLWLDVADRLARAGQRHLAFEILSFERALEAEFAFEQYALSNVHEFFAVNYQHALCERYGIRLEREHDDEGLLAEAIALYAAPT